jgi:hypothetical protein
MKTLKRSWFWLGSEQDGSDIAMDFISREDHAPFDLDGRFTRELWTIKEGAAILALLQRQCWRRIWIVQEIVAARDLMVYATESFLVAIPSEGATLGRQNCGNGDEAFSLLQARLKQRRLYNAQPTKPHPKRRPRGKSTRIGSIDFPLPRLAGH